jgi:hypothetical protein
VVPLHERYQELVKPGLRLIRGLLSVVSATNEDDPDGLCQALVAIADRYALSHSLLQRRPLPFTCLKIEILWHHITATARSPS